MLLAARAWASGLLLWLAGGGLVAAKTRTLEIVVDSYASVVLIMKLDIVFLHRVDSSSTSLDCTWSKQGVVVTAHEDMNWCDQLDREKGKS